MSDPAVIGAVGRVAAAAVQRSSAPVRAEGVAPDEWDEEADERAGLLLANLQGNRLARLTQDQVEQIRTFVELPESVALFQFTLIARLGVREPEVFNDISAEYRETFLIRAEEFCSEKGYDWASIAADLWDLIASHMDSAFPDNKALALISQDEVKRIMTYIGSTEKIEGRSRPANIAFREIVDILGDPARFTKARNCLSDIRSTSEQHYAELNLAHAISHSVDNFRFDYGALYVSRTLRVQNTDQQRNDTFLTSPTGRPRCVVIGSPGVGKSTMTQHLVHQLSKDDDSPNAYAAAVVACKDVSNHDGTSYILGAISKSMKENLQLDVSEQDLNDLATLGRCFVIFDGIDEIVDIVRRRKFVRVIEAFATRYPLIPVLVTARRVGYGKAPFNAEFSILELDDFSDSQVVEYTRKWFEATERSSAERDAFLRETENVPDVRTNPLMLSLLCALYRARGYIPRNRREVYKACADLLFQRWDAMRHIEQPVDHRQYGTRLMQELALFFYKSQTAQAGVQEKQLRKIISQFFTATASVDEMDAANRAQDFLDFCADRAWLLTYQGTDDRDQRLFGFTHRTFMEYFAAEAIVRRSRTIEEIVNEIARAYEADASSVLADVIFQCADDKYDGGAREVVAGLMDKSRGLGQKSASKYISLCLRIMNAAPLPPASTKLILDALFQHWESNPPESDYTTGVAVFDLYRDPRNRFIAALREKSERARSALLRWARFYCRNETNMFDSAWSEDMLSVASEQDFKEIDDPALFSYLIDVGIVCIDQYQKIPVPWLLYTSAYGHVTPGPLFMDLRRRVWDQIQNGEDGKTLVSRALERNLIPATLQASALVTPGKLFASNLPLVTPEVRIAREGERDLDFLLWVCCFLYEATAPSFHELHELVDFVYGKEWFERAVSTRLNGVGVLLLDAPQTFSRAELASFVKEQVVPPWFPGWCSGNRSFVAEPDGN
ncbi:NACHT domain-containing protein [Streptomyces phaeochromogenes]|uniref:NACHT domain-containing protein n=1 Tax=Streptomyces phaeochromogenes TaxID=1923 RepID=UPI00369A63C6